MRLHRSTIGSTLLSLALIGSAAGCGADPGSDGSSHATARTASSVTSGSPSGSATSRRIVVAISVDGLNPEAITQLGPSGAPNFYRLMREGASTLNARSTYELTDTLPNHTSMMTGRPVGGSHGHQVTFNEDRPSSWLAKVAGKYRPGMFDVAHDQGITTSLFTSKTKFDFLNRSWNSTHGARDVTGADNGRDKIGQYVRTTPTSLAYRLRLTVVEGKRRLNFWHISRPDAAGHASGFMSKQYIQAVRDTDHSIGLLLGSLDKRPELKSRVTILLTADHGGVAGAHSHSTPVYANYRIPFVAWGDGVSPGTDLYALNPARTSPGTGRPGYDGPQPIRNMDIADASLSMLGLKPVVSMPGMPTLTFAQ